ncbi:hypothetical protein [Nocardioides iriomotensis]|uniref:DoxX family protein n=1 Tax=Nocardioides iriomotensis TaxID=715784 RepID=A0A4Q5J069_9ACTN|nr:hypothetical protein [Nocardioides iriomotensis]RYU10655.1 hypothetical protein ETU37_15455 [Nocardioides iriomotensis]
MSIDMVVPLTWLALGTVIVVSSLRARRSRRAYLVGVVSVSGLWVVAGALVNALFLSRGDDYSGFADGAPVAWVTDTWESLVVPHHTFFIGLLIAFEAVVGALVLVAGPARQASLLLLVAFNVAVVSFGLAYLAWTVPMVLALTLLWRAGRQPQAEDGPARSLTSSTRSS